MSDIRFQHVTKIFGRKVEAVKDLSFIINDGEYVSLIGPSGCGKTTALRLLAGTILPTKGQIFFDDKHMENVSIQDRNIGFVFQHFAIFPHMTVWENVAYGPTVRGRHKKDIESLVENALKSVQISSKAELYPPTLSAPDWQKTALARVLASEARILLLDEPLGALDQKIREEFQVFLRDLVKREKLTAIHVTHDQAEALTISDKVAVMNKGELIQLGSPTDLIYNPNHIFTSFFVGESDFLEGVVINDEEKESEVKIGQSIIRTHNTGVSKGKRVAVAVRREFFQLEKITKDADKITNNYINGTIIQDQFLGLLRRVRVRLENQQIIEAKIHAKYPIHFNENESVKVGFDSSLSRCFDYPKEGIIAALEM
ncbi:MAG: ABC transporter ATP-binding protein [Candidatus Heimdallarchaeota archaeon]|nr:ABC transporter ATP-binding protein [Candidatus Heimdallarchaeota archaeon]